MATEGVSSTRLHEGAGRIPAMVSGDLLKEKEKDGGDDDEYDRKGDYGGGGYGLYDTEREDLDYTACSPECGYCMGPAITETNAWLIVFSFAGYNFFREWHIIISLESKIKINCI
jgi:hypothetical protein